MHICHQCARTVAVGVTRVRVGTTRKQELYERWIRRPGDHHQRRLAIRILLVYLVAFLYERLKSLRFSLEGCFRHCTTNVLSHAALSASLKEAYSDVTEKWHQVVNKARNLGD